MTSERSETKHQFTPPLGYRVLTPLYNFAIATFTREGAWRTYLVQTLAPQSNDLILDIGCGTGRLAHHIHRVSAEATYLGLDPDQAATDIAKRHAQRAALPARFVTRFFDGSEQIDGRPPNKIILSLVLHQTAIQEKRRIIAQAYKLLPQSGMLFIADYGEQRTALMRFLFRWTVQALDGVSDTQPNADGILPELLTETGFASVTETATFATTTGSISILRAQKNTHS